jgi:hypothetical protein
MTRNETSVGSIGIWEFFTTETLECRTIDTFGYQEKIREVAMDQRGIRRGTDRQASKIRKSHSPLKANNTICKRYFHFDSLIVKALF